MSSSTKSHGRKLQDYDNGNDNVEMFAFLDAGLYYEYYAAHGSDWYEELESYMFDVINDADSMFTGLSSLFVSFLFCFGSPTLLRFCL